ncbi:MAG: FeoA family protein [Rhodothermales bacterium]|nr:FeoA family protein [Rhodothermales bacterium]
MCNLVRCPSCHYEFAETYPKVSWLRRLLSRQPSPLADNLPEQVQPASELPFGTEAEVMCVGGAGNGREDRLAVFGLAPGALITVIQQRPSCVLKIDETELALDPEIAAQILVRVVEKSETAV